METLISSADSGKKSSNSLDAKKEKSSLDLDGLVGVSDSNGNR